MTNIKVFTGTITAVCQRYSNEIATQPIGIMLCLFRNTLPSDMKNFYRIIASVLLLGAASAASAQYYAIANQVQNMLSTALSGSFKYKGYVDASATAGLGQKRANFLGISTTQGFQYASWFFMGAGLGVDVALSRNVEGFDENYNSRYYGAHKTKAMIPLFSDFRFKIGGEKSVAAFIDIKAGATWLIGNGDLLLDDGATLGHGTQFYLKPSLGLRIPVNSDNTRQAINIGITYQLITSDNNYSYYDDTVSLNNLGMTISYEW